MYKIQRYGWRRDRLDPRDKSLPTVSIPESITVDLRSQMPPVYDQGQLGSCTANGMAGQLAFLAMRDNPVAPVFMPSRLFIYYFERRLEGSVDSDAGAEPRDGIKVMAADGAPPEDLWPYNISQFTVRPPPSVLHEAKKMRVAEYYNLKGDIASMRWCLKMGYPFGFGFVVYDSFESDAVANTGVVPMPNPGTETPIGGHYVVAVGCNDAARTFIVRNSWGAGWGDKGYCYMPYDYLGNPDLASDFWTLRGLVS